MQVRPISVPKMNYPFMIQLVIGIGFLSESLLPMRLQQLTLKANGGIQVFSIERAKLVVRSPNGDGNRSIPKCLFRMTTVQATTTLTSLISSL